MSDSTAYDEDTIVSLWTEIHNVRVKLGIIDSKYIKFPPTNGHEIDHSLVSTIEIDDRVRRFLKRIPHLSDEHFTDFGQKLVHTTDLASYLSARDVAMSRDANRFSFNFKDVDTLDLTNLRPSDVVLSHDEEGEGFWMILDTQENTIRSPNMQDLHRQHYREVRAEPARVALQRILQEYRNLEYCPDGDGDGGFLFPDEAERLRPILRERYGWPDSFSEDDWKRDIKEVTYGIRHPEHG